MITIEIFGKKLFSYRKEVVSPLSKRTVSISIIEKALSQLPPVNKSIQDRVAIWVAKSPGVLSMNDTRSAREIHNDLNGVMLIFKKSTANPEQWELEI